jgi:hypothetical protein
VSKEGTPPDEHAERQILCEKYWQMRRTIAIVFGTLIGICLSLAFYDKWQSNANFVAQMEIQHGHR